MRTTHTRTLPVNRLATLQGIKVFESNTRQTPFEFQVKQNISMECVLSSAIMHYSLEQDILLLLLRLPQRLQQMTRLLVSQRTSRVIFTETRKYFALFCQQ